MPIIARRSRRRRFHRRPGLVARTCLCHPAVPRPVPRPAPRAVPRCPWASLNHRCRTGSPACPTLRPRGFIGSGSWSAPGEPGTSPASLSLDRAASRRRVVPVPKSPFVVRPFGSLPRRANPRLDALDDARAGPILGNNANRPVIHFRQECQWTRVDNSTVRRNRRRVYPRPCDRVARAACRRSALSLTKPCASCWS